MWRDDYDGNFDRRYDDRGYGRGYGMGYGRGYGRGMGRGYGMGYGRGYGRGYGYEDEGYYRRPTAEDEIRDLNDYKKYLQDELSFVEERLQQLNKENGGE